MTEDTERLGLEWLGLDTTRVEIVARQDEIKALLREQLGVGKDHRAGRVRVDVIEQRRFNAERAEKVLDEETLAEIVVPMVSTDLARKVLSKEEYAECQIEVGQPKVLIR